MSTEFVGFPKIARLKREAVITEKIDGTNASITIFDAADAPSYGEDRCVISGELAMIAGSRTRFITPKDDNYGFASWVWDNAAELSKLGPGQHFGEWWGGGIQRGYGLTEKRFSLFNTSRWTKETLPACCRVVPVLYQGIFSTDAVDDCIGHLRECGSAAAPGYELPEGVVVYLAAARQLFKVTLEGDEKPKGSKE